MTGAEPVQPLSGRLEDGGHRFEARIYYADTDFSGVVYHARYLELLERGRTDFLRLTGIHHTALAAGDDHEKLVWVVRRMEIDFRQPARMDDVVTVKTRVERVSGARIFMAQQVLRDTDPVVSAMVEAAIMTPDGRPRRFPKEWAALFLGAGQPS
jgi:acyl-CoA thioester hydrolase